MGHRSCHESEQDYFNYARKVGEVVKGDTSPEAKVMVQQAKGYSTDHQALLTKTVRPYKHKWSKLSST